MRERSRIASGGGTVLNLKAGSVTKERTSLLVVVHRVGVALVIGATCVAAVGEGTRRDITVSGTRKLMLWVLWPDLALRRSGSKWDERKN